MAVLRLEKSGPYLCGFYCLILLKQQKKKKQKNGDLVDPEQQELKEFEGCSYGCTVKELKELMKFRGHEGFQKLQQDYNGVLQLCNQLGTSPTEGQIDLLNILLRFQSLLWILCVHF